MEYVLDLAASAHRIPPLRYVQLADSAREVRFWLGSGRGIPSHLIRVLHEGERIDGEVVRWWDDAGDPEEKPQMNRFRARMLRSGCAKIETVSPMQTCLVRPKRTLDWRGFMWRIDSLAVWTVATPPAREITAEVQPDGSQVLSGLCHDGTSLVVELLAGAKYRTYTYSSCADGFGPAGEALQALVSRHLTSAVADPRTRSPDR